MLLLREERLRQNISATALAAAIGLSRTTITHIENDQARPTLWVLIHIAEGLQVNLPELMARASAPPKRKSNAP
ncbi:helix-turn-helix transcriptional regulator [Prosthecobacter sp. SYSU 5D2]|uniref:helix-turn-helix domain-containing protein n=1 Tax=Prosthecobacter sp. SYSU 5D2 TaxID=3134134 RepID=UPI0031FE960F